MLTRSQRRFSIFYTLCEDLHNRQSGFDWYDREAMNRVLQCGSIREVWCRVVLPYNETYFREELQSMWDTAGHLARRHELSDGNPSPLNASVQSKTNENAGGAGVYCLSTTL